MEETNEEQWAVRQIAKTVAELSGETVLVAFDPHTSYYAGVSNLLGKPDFHDRSLVLSMGEIVDQFDDVIASVFDQVSGVPHILIGAENPFGVELTSIFMRYRFSPSLDGVLGLLGPVRMDYEKNLSMIVTIKDLFNDAYAE